jgi:hypothetical protein
MQDKTPRNEYGEPHGQWICYNSDGTIWFMDHNINGVEYGYCIILQMRDKNDELIFLKQYYAR